MEKKMPDFQIVKTSNNDPSSTNEDPFRIKNHTLHFNCDGCVAKLRIDGEPNDTEFCYQEDQSKNKDYAVYTSSGGLTLRLQITGSLISTPDPTETLTATLQPPSAGPAENY